MTIKDIEKFEKNNPDLAVNVFTFIPKELEGEFGKYTIYPISPTWISERILPEEKYINLLHYKDEDDFPEGEHIDDVKDIANYHYAWIKNFSRLVSKANSKHIGEV